MRSGYWLILLGGVLFALGADWSEPGWSGEQSARTGHCVQVEPEEGSNLDVVGLELAGLRAVFHAERSRSGYGLAHPEWSPDGTLLLFTNLAADGCSDCSGSQVWMHDTRSDETTALVNHARSGAWSPDGTKIAFLSGKDRGGRSYGLGILVLETGEEVILPVRPTFKGHERLSWDHTGIVIGAQSGGRNLSFGGYRIDLDDLSAEPLGWTHDFTDEFNLRKSERLHSGWAFHVFTGGELPFEPGPPAKAAWGGLWAVNVSNRYAVRIADLGGHSPAYSPDGRRLAFIQLDDSSFNPVSDAGSVMIVDPELSLTPIPSFVLDANALPGLVVGDALGVYSARTNPLTQSVIGYVQSEYKGSVVVTRIEGEEATVRPLIDSGLIDPGDVAACPTDRRGWRGEASHWSVLGR